MAAWGAAIAAVGSIAGGLIGNKGKKKALKMQKKALKYQIFSDQQARNDLAPYRQSGYQALNAYNRAMGLGPVSVPSNQNLTPQQIYSGQYGSFGGDNTYSMTPEIRQALKDSGVDIPEYIPNTYNQDGTPVTNDRYGGFYASPGYQFRMDEGMSALDRSAASRGRLRSGAQNKAITRYAQGIAADEFGNYTNRLAQIAGLGGGAATNSASLAANSGANVANSMANIGAGRQSGYEMWGDVATNLGNVFGDALNRRREQNNINNGRTASGIMRRSR